MEERALRFLIFYKRNSQAVAIAYAEAETAEQAKAKFEAANTEGPQGPAVVLKTEEITQ